MSRTNEELLNRVCNIQNEINSARESHSQELRQLLQEFDLENDEDNIQFEFESEIAGTMELYGFTGSAEVGGDFAFWQSSSIHC